MENQDNIVSQNNNKNKYIYNSLINLFYSFIIFLFFVLLHYLTYIFVILIVYIFDKFKKIYKRINIPDLQI